MREYRGKRLDGNGWVYGDLVHKPRNKFDSGIRTFIYKAVGEDYGWFEVDPATVGQQVGLKDMNGVEIYKGDIYTYFQPLVKNGRQIHKKHHIVIEDIIVSQYKVCCLFQSGKSVEIIGNSTDNPELMEVK